MTTSFALPTPAGNGVGTPVDISLLGADKTIIHEGNGSAREPYVIIEISNDALGVNWSTLVMLQRPGTKTVTVAARWMRASITNYRGGGAPVVNVGGEPDGTAVTSLAVPAGNGVGVGIDISSMPGFKTIQVTGTYRGSLAVEASNDGGASYSLAAAFPAGGGGLQSMVLLAEFVRVRRSGLAVGALNPGTAVVSLGAASTGGSGEGDSPIQPEFPVPAEVFTIYARTTGDDVTGLGTLASPYATMTRAVRDVPSIIAPGVRYVVDITGDTGVSGASPFIEATPLNYEFPCWKAPEAFDDQTSDPDFPTFKAVSIQATPKLMGSISVADATITTPGDLDVGGFPASGVTAINAAGVPAGYSFDPITGNLTLHLTVARASWAADALKGKFLTDVDATLAGNAVILGSTNTSLTFGNSVAPAAGVLLIKEPSAWLQVSSNVTPNSNRGGLNAYNIDSIAFNGLKVTITAGNFGLSWVGTGFCTAQLCELQAPNFSSYNMNQCHEFACWIYGARVRFQGANSLQRSLVNAVPVFNVFAPAQLHIRHSLVDGCGVINAARSIFAGAGMSLVPADLLFVEQSTIRNGTSHGIQFNGGRARLFAADIYNNAGNGLLAGSGPGYAEILSCGTSGADNGAAGVRATDGLVVKVDAATSGAANPLTGATGDMIIGGGAARTWANFVSGADGRPALNEYDITLAAATGATGTGTRLFQ